MSASRAFGVTAIEVVGSQFLVGDPVAHNVEGNLENLTSDRHDGLLVSALSLDAVIAGL
jgi:hypothetical protein